LHRKQLVPGFASPIAGFSLGGAPIDRSQRSSSKSGFVRFKAAGGKLNSADASDEPCGKTSARLALRASRRYGLERVRPPQRLGGTGNALDHQIARHLLGARRWGVVFDKRDSVGAACLARVDEDAVPLASILGLADFCFRSELSVRLLD
jgi:hypothetical protein